MDKIRRVSIIGLGAIGCAYLGRIADNMNMEDIRVIADRSRQDKYKEGVLINKKRYHFPIFDPQDEVEPADLLIIAVKFNQLEQAIESVKNHVGEETIIISMLNGVTSEKLIGERYGMQHLLYSILVGIDAVRERTDVIFSNFGFIAFGEEKNDARALSENTKLLKDFFETVHIDYKIPADMVRMLWWKLMVNVGINQTSAIIGGTYGVFQNVKAANELMVEAMTEVTNIAKKIGIDLTKADIEEWQGMLQNLSPAGMTSMYQDVKAERQTEVAIFAGTIVEMGESYGVDTPVNSMYLKIIRAMEGKFEYRNQE